MTMAEQLSFLAPQPTHQASATELRLITWNVQHASPARSRAQVAWLAKQPEADVVVLTEVSDGPGGDTLIQALRESGYPSIVAPTGGGDYRTVVAARSPHFQAHSAGVDVLPHRCPAASLTIGEHRVGVIGIYVPSRGPKERRNEDKRAFQNAVAEALPSLVEDLGGLVAVAGDLNVVEPGHIPHYPVFGDWEYDFYRSFAQAGLVDAYRTLHPDTVEHSWFGRGGNGYRIDHAFITAAHQQSLLACDYRHDPRAQGVSDHSAMFLSALLSPVTAR